jgi:hypothetical protein
MVVIVCGHRTYVHVRIVAPAKGGPLPWSPPFEWRLVLKGQSPLAESPGCREGAAGRLPETAESTLALVLRRRSGQRFANALNALKVGGGRSGDARERGDKSTVDS